MRIARTIRRGLAACACAAAASAQVTPPAEAPPARSVAEPPHADIRELWAQDQEWADRGFVQETLAPLEGLRALGVEISRKACALVRPAAGEAESLALFNRYVGVLAGYDPVPRRLEVPPGCGAEAAEQIRTLDQVLAVLAGHAPGTGRFVWVRADLAARCARLPPPRRDMVLLLSARPLWRAPSMAADRDEKLAGPAVLYRYGVRHGYVEVGPGETPDNTSALGYAEEADLAVWPAAGATRLHRVAAERKPLLSLAEAAGGTARSYEVAQEAVFPVLDAGKGWTRIRLVALDAESFEKVRAQGPFVRKR